MEAIFLGLCFGSCLKGEGNNIELYEALGFDNNRVSQEDIKQAFRKKTLQLHPDKLAQKGIQASPEDSIKFVKCKEAYEILSDKKRRKRYDQVGLLGLKILENPREINPSELIQNFKRNQGDRYKVALFLGLVFGIILIFPIIFALKCDNSSKYGPWTAIWTPMWLVDLLLFMAACYLCASKDDVDDDGTVVVEKITNTVKIFNFLETVLFILIQIFILIKLDDVVNWSWASTFAPWYVYEFVGVLSLIGPAVQSSTAPAPDTPAPHHEEGTDVEQDPRLRSQMIYFEILITKVSANVQICASLFRLWLAIFLAIKLDGKDWNWGLVFLPIWTYFAFQYLVSRYYRIVANNLLQGLNKEDLTHRIQTEADVDPLHVLKFQQHEQMKATSSTVICAQIVPVFMSIMLVCRLESASYSTFLIILPVVRTLFLLLRLVRQYLFYYSLCI